MDGTLLNMTQRNRSRFLCNIVIVLEPCWDGSPGMDLFLTPPAVRILISGDQDRRLLDSLSTGTQTQPNLSTENIFRYVHYTYSFKTLIMYEISIIFSLKVVVFT